MEQNKDIDMRHRGRAAQVPIFLKKFFRMFVYMNDWKVIPMSALVAGIVSIVVAENMFLNMEGTIKGALALSCICIWNGFFNSIQSICRERDVVKREHRNGMHITSYVFAHMIYQAFICLAQTIVTIVVCKYSGMNFLNQGFVLNNFYLEIGITMFLITFSSDMMSLAISGIAKSTTAAMTVMPFMLIFELVFSNSVFQLPERIKWMTDFSIARWGVKCIASQSNYNSLPMVTMWNQLQKWSNMEYEGLKPIKIMSETIDKETFCMKTAEQSQIADYATTTGNIVNCWMALLLFALIFALITVLALKRIDKDKR